LSEIDSNVKGGRCLYLHVGQGITGIHTQDNKSTVWHKMQ